MRRIRARWKIGALLVVALVAAACGSSGSGGSSPKAAEADPAGILRLPVDLTQPQSGQFDPVHVDVVLSTIHEYIYGTLLQLDANGRIQPALAEKVDIVDSSNLVVTLKSGLKFTDGTVLDADALKFSWERTTKEAKPGGIEAEFREFDLLTVTSPTVMKVHLKTPIAGAFFRLMRLAESSPVSPTAVKAGVDFDKAPVGAGPFKFVSYTPGVSIKLTKNPDYVNASKIKLGGIEYTNVTPQALTNAIRPARSPARPASPSPPRHPTRSCSRASGARTGRRSTTSRCARPSTTPSTATPSTPRSTTARASRPGASTAPRRRTTTPRSRTSTSTT
jgi:ABC-type transport system substrate-binding protein